MSTKIINVPVNRLDDRVYTHHLIPHIIKELDKKISPIIVITDKDLFSHGLIIASENTEYKSIHYNELNKLFLNILNGSLTDTLQLFDNLGILNKLLPYTTTEAFFFQTSQFVMRNALTVVKRLYDNDAKLSDLKELLTNTGRTGNKMVSDFQRLPTQNSTEAREQEEIALWFFNDYFTGYYGERGATKTYDYACSVRMNLMNFIDEWATISDMEKYPSQFREKEDIPVADLITINLSPLKTNKANVVKYLIHKLSQSNPNSTFYIDLSITDDIEWESLLLNNRNISKIIQTSSFFEKNNSYHHYSTKRIQSFRGYTKINPYEIEKQIALYYESLSNAKQPYPEETELATIQISESEITELGLLDLNITSVDLSDISLEDETGDLSDTSLEDEIDLLFR